MHPAVALVQWQLGQQQQQQQEQQQGPEGASRSTCARLALLHVCRCQCGHHAGGSLPPHPPCLCAPAVVPAAAAAEEEEEEEEELRGEEQGEPEECPGGWSQLGWAGAGPQPVQPG